MPAPKSEVHLTGKQLKEQRFAFMIATGRTQVDAYSAVFNVEGLSRDVIEKRASRLANKAGVIERGRAFLKEQNIADLDSAAECVQDLLADLRKAREAANWTAVAALTRLRGQMHGVLKDSVHVQSEQKLTDEQVAQRIAGGDLKLAAMLRARMGSGDEYEK
jgi:hypothetical protein